MANLITVCRALLLFLVVVFAYRQGSWLQFFDMPLIVAIFVSDAVDGWVARTRNETTLFGALFDIAVDRIVENVLWVVLADLNLVPIWVPIVFLVRGSLVDAVRANGAAAGTTPFGMMRSWFGRFLVAGRFMRIAYAVVKGVAFGWILLMQPLAIKFPGFWATWGPGLSIVTAGLVYSSVALCLARGLPVIAEFAWNELRNGNASAVQ